MDILKGEKFLTFDNILPESEVIKIDNEFKECPWNVSGNLVSLSTSTIDNYKDNPNVKDYLKFTHDFYDLKSQSDNTKICDVVFNGFLKHIELDNVTMFRAKANLQTQFTNNNEQIHNTPHVDMIDMPHYVLIYYVNDSDGDTILFNEDESIIAKISPKKGRYLIFNGNTLHAGSNPTNKDYRIIINYNFGV